MNYKIIIAILLIFCMLFALVFYSSRVAYADPFTAAMVGQLSYGVGSLFGLEFAFSGFDNASITSFMEDNVNSYLEGRSITEVFGAEFARALAGKLIIPAQLYNGIRDFLNSFVEESNISRESKDIFIQSGDYIAVSLGVQESTDYPENYIAVWGIINSKTGEETIRSTGTYKPEQSLSNDGLEVRGYSLYGKYSYTNSTGLVNRELQLSYTWNNPKKVSSSISGSIDVTPIGDDNVFQGENVFEPWAPDTNLDEMLDDIIDQTRTGDIDITGEIVEPGPAPTPVPTIAPDIPLSDVPWEGLNDLIDSSTDTIGDAIQDQTDAITGAQESTTEAVESLTETIEGVLDTPTSEELPQFKFDLRELFPFCIPFDIYRLLTSFDAEPVAPHVQLPIVIDSINFRYNLDLDFSAWNPVAQAMRTAELIVYAIALAWATGKVIKW